MTFVAKPEMTSLERVLTALGHSEADRVPFFLPVTMHGARELGMSIEEYYSKSENIAEGQLRMRKKYRHDFVYNFTYAAAEHEAFGSEVLFFDDGPPNSGAPVIRRREDIAGLMVPDLATTPSLQRVLRVTELLRDGVGGEAVIVGVVMSPFSLPVMQMGFEAYIELMYEAPELVERLMHVNEEFCVEWGNAQLAAGATAIGYFDPVSSPTSVPREIFLKWGLPVAERTIARIAGPVAALPASGLSLPIVDDFALAGAAMIQASSMEDLGAVKSACSGRLTVMGNLNGIEMRRWNAGDAEAAVKHAIAQAGPGGGFVLSDTHGEIPFQVPEDVLLAISEAVHEWGRYPLDWIES